MSFLKKIGRSAKAVQNQNVFEAIVAACMLIAAADGDIEKKELDKVEKLLAANDSLAAFKPAEKRKLIDKYSAVLEADFRLGKAKLLKEIGDISDNSEQSEEVFICALSVAESDGELEAAELNVLKEIGRTLGVSLNQFGIDA